MSDYTSYNFKGQELRIFVDENPESPRDWSNLGTMLCWHKNYDLGDKHNFSTEEADQMLRETDSVVLPIYMYDHSGIGISTNNAEYPYNCPWDSGQLGYIYVTREKILKEWGGKVLTRRYREKTIKILQSEVDTYHTYLSGGVLGYNLMLKEPVKCSKCGHIEEDVEDSCWGFYSMEDIVENLGGKGELSEWEDAA